MWLTYWLIFAMFSSVEFLLDGVGAYLPFYYEAKVTFLLWLTLDKFQGATLLFDKYIAPLLAQHSPAIDSQIDFLTKKAQNLKMDDLKNVAEFLQSKAKGAGIAVPADSTTGQTIRAEKPAVEKKEQAEAPEEEFVEPIEDKKDL